jgi:hypothetical protein
MADVRRTKKSRPAEKDDDDVRALAAEADLGKDDDSERALARLFALGVPLVGLAGALAVGSFVGLAPGILVLAGAALLGTIGFFWASLRTLSGDAPLPRGVAAHAIVSRVPAPERKRETLRALKDLELEHSIGKIDDADFAELNARYRATAKALMREIDAGLAPRREQAEELVAKYLEKRHLAPVKAVVDDEDEPAPAPKSGKSARLECTKCYVSNEPDAAFCKKCGSKLSAPDGAEDKSDAAV